MGYEGGHVSSKGLWIIVDCLLLGEEGSACVRAYSLRVGGPEGMRLFRFFLFLLVKTANYFERNYDYHYSCN